MPDQDLSRNLGRKAGSSNVSTGSRLARCAIFTGTILLSALLVRIMSLAVGLGNATIAQWLLVSIFSLASLWITFPAVGALYAAVLRIWRRRRSGRRHQEDPATASSSRIVLVMPVYNEDPCVSFAALQAMAEELHRFGGRESYEIFLLSDSNDPDAIVREVQAFSVLRSELEASVPAYYRRRVDNRGKKAGNLREFLERWGGRYDYMVVLDADSLMSGETVSQLVGRMDRDPDLGLLQSLPALTGATTPFARLQQFASSLYGPLIAEAVALWQGDDGNFWGHNAIIRVSAFAAACGLPELRGRPPFGGHIMSHDFVEAALLRRAGWKVRMATDIGGSWEQPPQTMLSYLIRDRRWAQGNLQHLKVIGAKGLAPISRLHLAIGVMSYLSSLVWLSLILLGLAIAVQARFVRPEYFPKEFQLFPTWPVFDTRLLVTLLLASIAILLTPKLLALGSALISSEKREHFGGGFRLIASFLLEVLLSALLAPVMMIFQVRHLWEILSGRDAGWKGGARAESHSSRRQIFDLHKPSLAVGLLILLVAWVTAPGMLLWLSPVILGLLLAPLTDWLSGQEMLARWLADRRLLSAPEEQHRPAIMERFCEMRPRFNGVTTTFANLESLFHSNWALKIQTAAAPHLPPTPRGKPDSVALVTDKKIEEARSLEELLGWLDQKQRLYLLSSARRLRRAGALAAGPVTPLSLKDAS